MRGTWTEGPDSLPDGWRWATLADICERVAQIDPRRTPSRRFRYIDISAVDSRTNRITETKDVVGREAPTRARKPVREGDVLFSTVRTYLRNVALVPAELTGEIASTGFCVLRAGSAVDPGFLFRHVLTDDFIARVSELQRGISYPAVTDRDVYAQPIPLPPLPEQQRLVEKIERLLEQSRTAREALDRIPPLLKRFRQAVLAKAFRGELTERDPNDEPASVLLERIREERRRKWEEDLRAKGKDPHKAKYVEAEAPDTSGVPELPEGWVWASVAQIANVRLGRQRSPSKAHGPHMTPYLRAGNVTWTGLDLSDVKQMEFTPSEQEVYRLESGDLVLSEASGSASEAGKPAIWRDEIIGCCFQNTIIRVRSAYAPPEYLRYHFLDDAMSGRFAQATTGIGINHLGANRLSQSPVALAPTREQWCIVEAVDAHLARVDAIEIAVTAARWRAEHVDQAILARAFRGEL